MPTDPNVYISMMRAIIVTSDGTFEECYPKFEETLVTTDEARLAWDCFDTAVKRIQVKRYYDRACWFIAQEQMKDEQPIYEHEPADVTTEEQSSRRTRTAQEVAAIKASLPATTRQPAPSSRTSRSALLLMKAIAEDAEYNSFTDHRGNKLGNLTRRGLEEYIKKENSVALRFYAELLRQNMPESSRSRDIVRNYVSKENSGILWKEAQQRASVAA